MARHKTSRSVSLPGTRGRNAPACPKHRSQPGHPLGMLQWLRVSVQAENQCPGLQLPCGCRYTNGLPLQTPATSLTPNLCCAGMGVAFPPCASPLGPAGTFAVQTQRDWMVLGGQEHNLLFP